MINTELTDSTSPTNTANYIKEFIRSCECGPSLRTMLAKPQVRRHLWKANHFSFGQAVQVISTFVWHNLLLLTTACVAIWLAGTFTRTWCMESIRGVKTKISIRQHTLTSTRPMLSKQAASEVLPFLCVFFSGALCVRTAFQRRECIILHCWYFLSPRVLSITVGLQRITGCLLFRNLVTKFCPFFTTKNSKAPINAKDTL